MARYLLFAMPFAGHVAPVAALAASLVTRGHHVRFYTGAAFRSRVEAVGAVLVPWERAPDFDEQNLPATFPRLVGKKGFAQLMVNMEDLFVGTAARQQADLKAEWARMPWDVLVADEASLGPRLVAESLGCRWVTIAVLPLMMISSQGPPSGMGIAPGRGTIGRARDAALRALVPALSGRLVRASARQFTDVGLPPVRESFDRIVFSPQRVLAAGVRSLDYGRTARPARLDWVGRLTAQSSAAPALPPWWRDLDGRRVVHLTQGTQNIDPSDLIQPALDALADTDVIVAVSTGRRGQHALPFAIPANARVADLLPYEVLLPRTDVMVTNGGWGGVLAALSYGVPLVIGGGDLDKPEVAARVEWSGAGVNLHTGRPSAAKIRSGYDAVAGNATFREAAIGLAEALATAGGAEHAATLIEEFTTRGAP